ncbi:MAG: LuxR family transcriptional regulator [Nocardioides sp.]|nr:LuxR family transcriptional regulator [Nocardioides sp.]
MGSSYGPVERRVLESAAADLYTRAVESGALTVNRSTFPLGTPEREAVDLLIDLGLLTQRGNSKQFHAVDPSAVQSRVVVPIGQKGADLLAESARWAEVFSTLGQAYRRSPRLGDASDTEIRGYANINRFLQATVADCRSELLTAQPSGARSAATLAVAVERDIKALDRGVAMRTLYQHSARRSTATRDYVQAVTAHGGEVRTLDEFFNRLIVVDRQLAIIPGAEGNHVAVATHQPALVAYLADVFERSWERARPYVDRDSTMVRDIAEDVRAMTIRMLVEGHSDPASAKRIGVSTRTYAGYIASLKEEYGVQTRFQLGHAMGGERRRGEDLDAAGPYDDAPEA